MNILFVCTGNTCRSSMAEGILKDMLEKNNIKNINVSSAGISAFEGDNANEKAINTLNNMGIDILNHKARLISKEIIEKSDLILTMTLSHKKMILKFAPEFSNKVYTLKEYALIVNNENNCDNMDIVDPFGLDYNAYEKTAKEIQEQLTKIISNFK